MEYGAGECGGAIVSADTERWLPIDGFPDYEVSDLGRVRRATDGGRCRAYPAGTIIKPSTDRYGKQEVQLHRDGSRHCKRLARLVLETFVGECPAHHRIEWLDGDGSNNAVSNLAYVPTLKLYPLKKPVVRTSKPAAPEPPKAPKSKAIKQVKPKDKWQTLLNYYQQTLAAPDASPQHRAIASAGLRAILKRYQPGKSLTILRIDETTVPVPDSTAAKASELAS